MAFRSASGRISFSVGPYLVDPLPSSLPSGTSAHDYDQITLGYDFGYAWHHLQLWAEVFLNRFEVPYVGNADALAYYIEAKYKLTPGLFAAARWNQQLSGSIRDDQNDYQTWDRDMFRIDLALGYRFTRHLQGKVQYSYGHRDAPYQQGPHLVAVQATLRF
jgi:hypothetical protein